MRVACARVNLIMLLFRMQDSVFVAYGSMLMFSCNNDNVNV